MSLLLISVGSCQLSALQNSSGLTQQITLCENLSSADGAEVVFLLEADVGLRFLLGLEMKNCGDAFEPGTEKPSEQQQQHNAAVVSVVQ